MSFPSVSPSEEMVANLQPANSAFVLNAKSSDDKSPTFVDRRSSKGNSATGERRQFGSSHSELTEAGRELATAIDQYKVERRRRYITCDELLTVLSKLGYTRDENFAGDLTTSPELI